MQPATMPGGRSDVLLTIGDVHCTQTTVITPVGTFPLAGTMWTLNDMSQTRRRIPPWAIVVAIILFFACLIGLLFLLVTEERTEGQAHVTVQGSGLLYTTQVPIYSRQISQDINNRVNYARMLVNQLTG